METVERQRQPVSVALCGRLFPRLASEGVFCEVRERAELRLQVILAPPAMEVGTVAFPFLAETLHPDGVRFLDHRDEVLANIFAKSPDLVGCLRIERDFIISRWISLDLRG